MQIERGASNTFALLGRSILSPSYWLLWFRDPERNASVYCIATASNTTGGMLTLTFTETNTPTALDGEVKLSPRGNWELKVYEQTSPTNLDPANAGRLVKTIGLLVVGPEASDTGWSGTACPTDGDECDPLRVLVNGEPYATIEDPCGAIATVKVAQDGTAVGSLVGDVWVIPTCDDLSYSLVNSNDDELDSGSVPDPCGENLTLLAPDATIRATDTVLTVAQVPSGNTYDLPQTYVTYINAGGTPVALFLTDTGFDGLNLVTSDPILNADLRNSLGNVVGAAKVTAEDLMNDTVPTAPDGTITFDGLAVGTVPSGDTENLDCGTLLNAAYVEDGGSVTGTYLITGTLNGRNLYTLDVDHNLEYTGTRWRLVKPGSDVDAALGSETFPWLADWSATSVTVEQATIGAYCGGNEVPCADLTVAINGTTYGTVADPCGATASVNVHDSNGNDVGSLVSGSWVVAAPANVLREYTTGGSWSKPTDASFKGVWVFAAGAGGSGGAGIVTTGTIYAGGSAGGGGSLVRRWVPAVSLLTTETYAIGAGGTGPATGAGSAGGATLFGAHAEAKGGSGGVVGLAGATQRVGGAGGSALLNVPIASGNSISGAAGGDGQRTFAGSAGGTGLLNTAAPGGGGGGGGQSGAEQNGGAGGGVYQAGSLTAGGAAGVAPGGNGTAGINDIYIDPFVGLVTATIGIGTAGGGGACAAGASAVAGNGAAGGRAAGGGGGGSQGNGASGTRGAGGAGGDGFIILYEMFAI
jgi:hypothetical protein